MTIDFVKLAEIGLRAFRLLTVKRVLLLIALNVVALASVIVYLQREMVTNAVWPAKLSADLRPLTYNDIRKNVADEVLKTRGNLISSVGIVSIDAPANMRKVIYFRSNDYGIQMQYDTVVQQQISAEVQLWSKSQADNTILLRLLGGEIICRPYPETILYHYMPRSDVPYMCTSGIPPGYSRRLRGLVFVLLRATPNEVDEQRVKGLLLDLSSKLDVEIR